MSDVIDEAKQALKGVTPGPWWVEDGANSHVFDKAICADGHEGIAFTEEPNADFIAWAREGVPALLAEISAKDAEIARLKSDRPFIMGANHGYETAMGQVAEEARRYASHYAEATDGRNTFTMFAEWANRAALKGDTHE